MSQPIMNPAALFNTLYTAHYDKVLRFFRKDFSIEDAEDLTQQTFLQLWAWIPTTQRVKNGKALLFRIARNVRIDRYKQNAHTLESLAVPLQLDIADPNSALSLVELRLCLQKLSVKEQQLLFMKVQGYSSEEIGKAFGISASAARSRLQKIRKKLPFP